jgi:hypothetical protein
VFGFCLPPVDPQVPTGAFLIFVWSSSLCCCWCTNFIPSRRLVLGSCRWSAWRCFVLGVEFLPPPAQVPFSLLLLSVRRRVLPPAAWFCYCFSSPGWAAARAPARLARALSPARSCCRFSVQCGLAQESAWSGSWPVPPARSWLQICAGHHLSRVLLLTKLRLPV